MIFLGKLHVHHYDAENSEFWNPHMRYGVNAAVQQSQSKIFTFCVDSRNDKLSKALYRVIASIRQRWCQCGIL